MGHTCGSDVTSCHAC